MSRETLDAMRYVISAEPKRIFSFEIPDEAQRQMNGVCEAYLLTQLERGFGALDYWKSVRLK